MSFDQFWEETWKKTHLPSSAKDLLPGSLSEKTKQRMLRSGKSFAEVARIIETAVGKIDHGSIEGVDKLIAEQFDE